MARTKQGAKDAYKEPSSFIQFEPGSYLVPTVVLPCLALHNRDKDSFWKRHCPGLLCCRWNLRKPDPGRFGINVQNKETKENLLYLLSQCTKKGDVSALDGPPIILVLTSFVEILEQEVNEKFIFEPVLDAAPTVGKFKPTPITIEICVRAMKWLFPSADRNFTNVDDGISCYLEHLSMLFSHMMNKEKIQRFIDIRTWDDDFLPKNWLQGFNDESDILRMRQFLFDNIAWQTKIVAHVVDGIHRFTAVDMVQVGFNSCLEPKEIVERDSLKDINVRIRTVVPSEITNVFVDGLLKISAESQEKCARQEEHSILQFLLDNIPELRTECEEQTVPFLYTSTPDLYDPSICSCFRDPEDFRNTMWRHFAQSDLAPGSRNEWPELYLTHWTKCTVNVIKSLLEDSKHLNMISHDGHESVQKQFSELPSWFQSTGQFVLFPFSVNETSLFTIQKNGDLFYNLRFGKKITPVLFIVAHLLLWSRLTPGTCKAIEQVLTFFSRHGSYNEADIWVEKQRNMELFFQSVVDAVMFSYSPWKTRFFIYKESHDNKAPMRNNRASVIYACLLISAIEERAKAFTTAWVIPKYIEVKEKIAIKPQDFHDLLTDKQLQMNEETAQLLINNEFDPFPNMLTFLVVAHAVHMGSVYGSCKQEKEAYNKHFQWHETFVVELPELASRNPFGQDSQGKWKVSIIGCKVGKDLGEMYTTRLSDYLSMFVESATDIFDFETAKKYFARGLISRFGRRFRNVVAPQSVTGSLGLLSEASALLTDLLPDDNNPPKRNEDRAGDSTIIRVVAAEDVLPSPQQNICSWSPCLFPALQTESCQYNGCGKPVHHLCQIEWNRTNNVPEGETIQKFCPQCDVLSRGENPMVENFTHTVPTVDNTETGRGTPSSLKALTEPPDPEDIVHLNNIFAQTRPHLLAPPLPGSTWTEVRQVTVGPTQENTEDKVNKSDDPKKKKRDKDPSKPDDDSDDDSQAEDDDSGNNDSQAEDDDSGKKRKTKSKTKSKKKRKKKRKKDKDNEPEKMNPRSESPLLPQEYEILDKLCDRLNPTAPLGICLRNLGLRPDKLGENSARLLDKICKLEHILAKYPKRVDGPIMNNGNSLDALLQDIGQQEDAIRENRARHVTKVTGGDADASSCASFPDEYSRPGNPYVETEAAEAQYENTSSIEGFFDDFLLNDNDEDCDVNAIVGTMDFNFNSM